MGSSEILSHDSGIHSDESQMNAPLESIQLISNLVQSRKKASALIENQERLPKERDYLELVEAVLLVSKQFENYSVILSADKKNVLAEQSPNYHLNAIKAVSLLASERHIPFHLPFEESFTFLEAISKNQDENFHSDFIASLLDHSVMGDFSHHLLKEILNEVSIEDEQVDLSKTIRVTREKRLDSIDSALENTEKGAKRIDLYIRHNNFVLIIENKISTGESENQTVDYYSVSKKIHNSRSVLGILLSPDGQSALEREFRPMTYRRLIMCLHRSVVHLESDFSKSFFSLYFHSLYKQFIESDFKYNQMVQNFWRQYNERQS